MTLPGVRTVLKDRFHTLSRTDIPDGTRVVAIGRRNNEFDSSDSTTKPDMTPYHAPGEERVIQAFGQDSELHRAYVELVAGGAARVTLVSWGSEEENPDSDIDEDLVNEAFDAAEIARPDIIVPFGRGGHPGEPDGSGWKYPETIGFRADEPNHLQWIANKCKEITDRSTPVFAVLGVEPEEEASDEDGSPLSPGTLEFSALPARDTIENGQYVSVVATELKTIGNTDAWDDWGWSNGAAVYAGSIASLRAENAPTGKPLFNVRRLRYTPTRTQQLEFIGKGLVPVSTNYRNQIISVDGLTFGKAESDFTRLTTLRITFDAIQLVRRACEFFVGMPATVHHRNSLETAVSSALRGMLVQGALTDADFSVTYVPRANEARVDLVIRPAFEMRNIEVSIAVQL